MAKFDVLDMNGKKVSTIELSDAVFGMTPNEKVMHAAVVNFLANQRQGTQNTKIRKEVSGGRSFIAIYMLKTSLINLFDFFRGKHPVLLSGFSSVVGEPNRRYLYLCYNQRGSLPPAVRSATPLNLQIYVF